MELWHPRARRTPVNKAVLSWVGPPNWKLVVHSTEGRSPNPGGASNYHGHQGWPHFEVSLQRGIEQFFPINGGVFTLENRSGRVETNRAHAIQVEVVGLAEESQDWPDELLRHLADVIQFVHEQTGMPLNFRRFHGANEGVVLASVDSPIRTVVTDGFTGICGHQHFEENDHWDPGALPVERLKSFLGPPTPKRRRRAVYMYWFRDGLFYSDGIHRTPFGLAPPVVEALTKQGVPILGQPGDTWSEGTHNSLKCLV